jgi:septal ring factor EnvC (AmiA/AmiB activator)
MGNRLRTLIAAAALAGCFAAPPGPAAQDVSTVQDKTRQAIEKEIRAQQQADEWSQEKEQLISEIRQNKTQLDWARYQSKKYAAYIEQEKEKVAELERQKEEMRSLRRNLEPYLDKLIANLETFIASDLTFLTRERKERIQFLRDSVNDYHLSMSEKLHRVLEALQVEAEYGRSIEANPATLDVEGQSVEAEVLRVGRIAVFFHSMDGEKAGRWNPEKKDWEYIAHDFSRPIRDTIEMAKQQKSVELVDLPIGGIE